MSGSGTRIGANTIYLDKKGPSFQITPWRMNLTAFSTDGELLFISDGYDVYFFAFDDWKPPKKSFMRIHSESGVLLNSIKTGYVGKNQILVSVDDEGLVRLYNVDSLSIESVVLDNEESSWGIALAQEPQMSSSVAVSANSHDISVWKLRGSIQNIIGSLPNYSLHGHLHNIPNIDFHPREPSLLVSNSIDCTLRIWDVIHSRQISKSKKFDETGWTVNWFPVESVIQESRTCEEILLGSRRRGFSLLIEDFVNTEKVDDLTELSENSDGILDENPPFTVGYNLNDFLILSSNRYSVRLNEFCPESNIIMPKCALYNFIEPHVPRIDRISLSCVIPALSLYICGSQGSSQVLVMQIVRSLDGMALIDPLFLLPSNPPSALLAGLCVKRATTRPHVYILFLLYINGKCSCFEILNEEFEEEHQKIRISLLN